MITAALAPIPLGVGMALMTNVLAELLMEMARRNGVPVTPAKLARIGRDGLYSALGVLFEAERDKVTLADDGVGGVQ